MLGGPHPKHIDWNIVDQLLQAGCNGTEIAANIGICPDTLYRRCEKDKGIGFAVYAQEKRASGDSLLRASQFKNALKGNTSMQIWLGKQRLGQRDNPDGEKFDAGDIRKAIQVFAALASESNSETSSEQGVETKQPLLDQGQAGEQG